MHVLKKPTIIETRRLNRLHRFGHVQRMEENRIPYEYYHIFSNLIRTRILVFADFLNEKKLVRGSNPHLSFNRPLPTRQTD